MTTEIEFQKEFFRQFGGLESLMMLFEDTPGLFFFAKDAKSRFVYLNQANLAIYDTTNFDDVVGKTDAQFHPMALATAYIEEDRRVMSKGKPIRNQLWLVPFLNGPLRWFLCTKTPIICSQGEVIGIAGVMHLVETPKDQLRQFGKLGPAIKCIEQDFREPNIDFKRLAAMCELSSTHFNRLFRTSFHMSPTSYLDALKIQEGKRLLATSVKTVTMIAMDIGFYDQSHFARRFRKSVGMSPSEYRKFCRTK